MLHQGLTVYNNNAFNNDKLLETLISLVKIAIQLLFKRIYCLTKNWKNIHNKVHNQYHNTLKEKIKFVHFKKIFPPEKKKKLHKIKSIKLL